MAAEFGLLVSFPDQSHSFTHGFEAGTIWQKLTDGEILIEELMVHRVNCEMIDRMGLHFECSVEWKSVEWFDEWALVTIKKQM
jgi:hypothetical protein